MSKIDDLLELLINSVKPKHDYTPVNLYEIAEEGVNEFLDVLLKLDIRIHQAEENGYYTEYYTLYQSNDGAGYSLSQYRAIRTVCRIIERMYSINTELSELTHDISTLLRMLTKSRK